MPRIHICRTEEEACERAAQSIAEAVRRKPRAVLGMATGRSPIGLYRELVRAFEAGDVRFREATAVNLDEYVGLGAPDPASFAAFMEEHLYRRVDFDRSRIHIPDGQAADLTKACERYDRILAEVGPRDVQILGIGLNGHIGFNEPGPRLSPGTHVVRLTEETRERNRADFPPGAAVPELAITMGAASILQARKVVFVAFGAAKAEIVREAFEGPITTACPGSLLRLHPNADVYLDEAAGRLLATT